MLLMLYDAALAWTLGPYSGAAFNPAVAIAISMLGLAAWPNIWVYMAGSLTGALLATAVFRLTEHE